MLLKFIGFSVLVLETSRLLMVSRLKLLGGVCSVCKGEPLLWKKLFYVVLGSKIA